MHAASYVGSAVVQARRIKDLVNRLYLWCSGNCFWIHSLFHQPASSYYIVVPSKLISARWGSQSSHYTPWVGPVILHQSAVEICWLLAGSNVGETIFESTCPCCCIVLEFIQISSNMWRKSFLGWQSRCTSSDWLDACHPTPVVILVLLFRMIRCSRCSDRLHAAADIQATILWIYSPSLSLRAPYCFLICRGVPQSFHYTPSFLGCSFCSRHLQLRLAASCCQCHGNYFWNQAFLSSLHCVVF